MVRTLDTFMILFEKGGHCLQVVFAAGYCISIIKFFSLPEIFTDWL